MHLGVCKTIGFFKEQNKVFICVPHADSLLPLCARWHHRKKWLRLPKIAMEENSSPYYCKSSSKHNLCSILPFVCLLCFLHVPVVLEVCAMIMTLGQTSQANTLRTHAPSKPDIRYLEINSVKRFGKFIVHAKTFKRHLGSSKNLSSFPLIFFTLFFNCWVKVTSNQNGSFMFPVHQNEGILSSTYISRC